MARRRDPDPGRERSRGNAQCAGIAEIAEGTEGAGIAEAAEAAEAAESATDRAVRQVGLWLRDLDKGRSSLGY